MTIDDLLNQPTPRWFSGIRTDDIVIGTVGRMVRNLRGFSFPGWSTEEERRAVSKKLLPVLQKLKGFENAFCAEMSSLSYENRRALLVRKLLTPAMAARQKGCYLVIPQRQNLTCMVNEEEHLVIHAFLKGNKITDSVSGLRQLNEQLEEKLKFAETPGIGYLTSMPGEAGDGIQIYSMLHLPGLSISNTIPQVVKAMEKLHLNLSPCYSDGEEGTGNMYILYTIPGPAGSTDEICQHYAGVLRQLIQRERQLRAKLTRDRELHLQDGVARAYATLCHARRISLRESRNAISLLRLGTQQGLITWKHHVPNEMVSVLRELDYLIAFTTAQTTENEEPALPMLRADITRDFMKRYPAELIDYLPQ